MTRTSGRRRKAACSTRWTQAGVSAIFADPEFGGPIAGPKSLATALAAYELAWVDGGAATCLIALGLALQPIISAGTAEQQRARYLGASVPPRAG